MGIRFYLDTHIAKQIAVQLRQQGVDVIRCEEVGMAEASDEAHLIYASEQGRVLVSMDEDFAVLHAEWLEKGKSHQGIIYVTSHAQKEAAVSLLVKTLLEYHQLIEREAGTIEADIVNHLYFI